MKLIKTPGISLFLLVVFVSCINNLNFDDADLNLRPIYNSPLVNFTLDQNDFFDEVNNIDILEINGIIGDFDFLQSQRLEDQLIRVEFYIEIQNEFDRNFEVTLSFLDEFDNVTLVYAPILITANQDNFTTTLEVFLANDPQFLNSRKLNVNVRMSASSNPIDPSIQTEFDFKSTGTYYLNL